jgi:hypothetical protein
MTEYRVKIEEYRGFDIMFDKSDEYFYPESAHYDSELKKAKSYAAAKKWVDDYVKANSEFIPVFATTKDGERIRIIGIRKDGQFMYVSANKPGDKPKQLEKYREDKYFLEISENEPHFEALDRNLREINALRVMREQLEKRLIKTSLQVIRDKYAV